MWQRSWQRKGHRVARGLGTVLCTAVVLGMGLLLAGWLVGCAELQYKPMVLVSDKPSIILVFYRLNSAIERGTKPDALG